MNTIQQINILFWMNIVFTGIYVVLLIYWLGRKGIDRLFWNRYNRISDAERMEEKHAELENKFNHLIDRLENEKTRNKKVR